MRLHVIPRLGIQRLDTLTRADVARLHHGMRATPGAANRVLALLSKMCALAEQWGLREPGSNPVRGIERFREKTARAPSDASGTQPPGRRAQAGGAGAHREPVQRGAGAPVTADRGTARGGPGAALGAVSTGRRGVYAWRIRRRDRRRCISRMRRGRCWRDLPRVRRQPVVSARAGAWPAAGQSAEALETYAGGGGPGRCTAARSAAYVCVGGGAGRIVACR